MNMNDKYIKMVLALPESFFDGWEWKTGDDYLLKYHNPRSHKETWQAGTIGDAFVTVDGVIGYPEGLDFKFKSYEGELRPLPSQKQLQDKILSAWKKNWTGFTYFMLVCEFWRYIEKLPRETIQEFIENKTDLDEMWLMFFMQEIESKKWDGENWI